MEKNLKNNAFFIRRYFLKMWVYIYIYTHTHIPTPEFLGFPGGSDGKESACNVGNLGSILGLGRSPGGRHGNPLQYSCLENPMDRGAWQATGYSSMELQRVRHDWATNTSACQNDGPRLRSFSFPSYLLHRFMLPIFFILSQYWQNILFNSTRFQRSL